MSNQTPDPAPSTSISTAALIPRVGDIVDDAAGLLNADGELTPGKSMITTVIALSLGFLSFMGVLAFLFPQYLMTPELRKAYNVDWCRALLFAGLLVSGTLSLFNIVFNRRRNVNVLAFAFVLITIALGGSKVPVGDFPDHTPYLGMDWLVLDLLGSTTVFVILEKLFPLYKNQPVFRKEWQTDLIHFGVNHLLVGLMLLIVNFFIHRAQIIVIGEEGLQQFISSIGFLPQLLLCLLVADLAEYAVHRAYHEVPWLWKVHSVHHSVNTLDWLAGSRLHMLEIIVTRIGVLTPLFLLGFDKSVVDMYIVIVGFQAVFNHANVHIPWGPLKYLIVTPDFHHWHHSSEKVAINKNYAAHFAFIDYLFGTAVKTDQRFPKTYGVVGSKIPDGYLKQQAYPFEKLQTKTVLQTPDAMQMAEEEQKPAEHVS
ncbi:sterol desaturase family protein [Massilia sp. Leaf139]|uniref:sterol desaturase family protein n=1 Tax=Massilia sp. Leaf139 TaxID=1736272 RepID=UPI0009ECA5DD|nr:sterol desaturase family protein [Massilia sp. Leaf139]